MNRCIFFAALSASLLALAMSTPAPAQVDPASLGEQDLAAESRCCRGARLVWRRRDRPIRRSMLEPLYRKGRDPEGVGAPRGGQESIQDHRQIRVRQLTHQGGNRDFAFGYLVNIAYDDAVYSGFLDIADP